MRQMTLVGVAALSVASFHLGGPWGGVSSAHAQANCDGIHRRVPPPVVEGTGGNETGADHALRADAKKKCEDFCATRTCAGTPAPPCQLDGFPITSKPKKAKTQPQRGVKLVAELRYCPCACRPTPRAVPDSCTKEHTLNPPYAVEGRGSNRGEARAQMGEHLESVCQAFCAAIACEGADVCDAVSPVTWEPRDGDCAQAGATWTCTAKVTKCKCKCLAGS